VTPVQLVDLKSAMLRLMESWDPESVADEVVNVVDVLDR
jgi:hypothetical protein